ncbi:efflux RND transporter permease subunit [Pseudidiomarina sp. 1APP75-32.1]|uniref:Efflux RND transporter permease subunit n=1 Tax=Pseudidiomarina terrestris TaxID=2820060 RepID=A0AAW7QX76_9GAMM|nr:MULTISPECIES: efflux RND transporter permease subunit [unclassified Pseudidiomarina]MDN7124364.1 efflux RND transporter permease subunit [Pseudidiomarina sp. 1APP75-32.1]MDN7129345.1 efflux RND transporter permease subunit [Pseudidiomarina sp. 1APR75-15]MDN7136921.1 efflux RND transporter permease subunit [Pseudidiomarina sp. 1ASP75-14]
MDIARYSIRRSTTSWLLLVLLLVGGVLALTNIGRLEDPEFTLKKAMVITAYPGASAQQVEEEVTYRLENAIQELGNIDHINSISKPGLSQITVDMKTTLRADDMPQIWDELRRKVNDVTRRLPPGAEQPIVRDDFADVYGIMLAVTGAGYSYEDIKDYTDFLRRELVLVEGVGKVLIDGDQQEQVIVEISRSKLANVGIPPAQVLNLLQTQNVVADAGRVLSGDERIRLHTTGEFAKVEDLADLMISNPGANERILLRDVATVSRDYQEIPEHLVRFNGQPSLWLGISFGPDVNVVDVGRRVEQRLAELSYAQPVGIDVAYIYDQPAEVDKSVQSFLLNLAEAVAIVVVALLLTMGLRSGVLIGSVLLVTVLGSFIFMYLLDIQLQRVSLGALIIALGMLVDNAIVIAEGMLVGVRRGLSRLQAASVIVQQNIWPLLGATAVAVIAFAPIGLSEDASGEYANSLFWVLFISLFLSWFTAITLTPFLGNLLYRRDARAMSAKDQPEDDDHVYQHWVFRGYRKLLRLFLQWRKTTMLVMLALLVAAVAGFTTVKQSFFPPSNTPMLFVDVWYPQGTDIRATAEQVAELEAYLQETYPDLDYVASTIGRGAPRFTLTYMVEKSYESYGQLILRAQDNDKLATVHEGLTAYLNQHQPDVQFKMKPVEMGPSQNAKIEARFSGPDPLVLHRLAAQAEAIMAQDPGVRNLRNDWRQRTKVLQPVFNEPAARRLGVTKADVNNVLKRNFNGQTVGLFRDGTQLMPIVVRAPLEERREVSDWHELQIYSPALQQHIPMAQVVSAMQLVAEDNLILRRDRKRTLTVMADHDVFGDETAAMVLERIRPDIEALPLPVGYRLEWGGEHEASQKATGAVFQALPLAFVVMFIITVLLFNSIRQAGVLWTTVPLSVIGVTLGLALSGQPFGFMALLGFLSLSGMLIKNGVVLLEQIRVELAAGKQALVALEDAAVTRVRPVVMAAVTTILGMVPLLFDDFFVSMAVVIMFGLGFATLLTLIVVPVMYALVMRVPHQQNA